jgi:hypothetical protein
MQHIHHDLIVAWAKGATIQWKGSCGPKDWRNCCPTPAWDKDVSYRIKPEPKPDVIRSYSVCFDESKNRALWHQRDDTLMLIFDGETGKLKDAQVLVNSGHAV